MKIQKLILLILSCSVGFVSADEDLGRWDESNAMLYRSVDAEASDDSEQSQGMMTDSEQGQGMMAQDSSDEDDTSSRWDESSKFDTINYSDMDMESDDSQDVDFEQGASDVSMDVDVDGMQDDAEQREDLSWREAELDAMAADLAEDLGDLGDNSPEDSSYEPVGDQQNELLDESIFDNSAE
ncbi:hypothetical protein FJ366_02480 [Candidatus Dependentiae bacterium]|nr:hypothetical protein [Candidatus Dependentiae bacterium]